MKTICSYCKKHLRGNPNASIISHGMCPECFRKASARWDFVKDGNLPVMWVKRFAA